MAEWREQFIKGPGVASAKSNGSRKSRKKSENDDRKHRHRHRKDKDRGDRSPHASPSKPLPAIRANNNGSSDSKENGVEKTTSGNSETTNRVSLTTPQKKEGTNGGGVPGASPDTTGKTIMNTTSSATGSGEPSTSGDEAGSGNGNNEKKSNVDVTPQEGKPAIEDGAATPPSKQSVATTPPKMQAAMSQFSQFFAADPDQESVGTQLKALARNHVYVSVVMTLSVLFFVVAGIQFWATKYFLDCFQPPEMTEEEFRATVLVCFAVCAATGPAVGVIIGGLVIDKIGEGSKRKLQK